MPRKHHKPEEIVAKLRQVDVLVSQGKSVADSIRAIGVTEVTYYRWRQEFVGLRSMDSDQGLLRAVTCSWRSQQSDSFGAHSGPSGGRPCRGALRPNATSPAAIRNVRFTSKPAKPKSRSYATVRMDQSQAVCGFIARQVPRHQCAKVIHPSGALGVPQSPKTID